MSESYPSSPLAGVSLVGDPVSFEGVITLAARSAIIRELLGHPETTLSEVLVLLDGKFGKVIGEIRIGELLEGRAGSAPNSEYDRKIVEVVREAPSKPVSPAYVRERVCGPRWKRQSAIVRLVESGQIIRTGVTSGTRYWPGKQSE